MKKRYKVRFYKAHDLDLITYIASHSIDIRVTLYYVVRAYCNGTVVGIRMPEQTGPPTIRVQHDLLYVFISGYGKRSKDDRIHGWDQTWVSK